MQTTISSPKQTGNLGSFGDVDSVYHHENDQINSQLLSVLETCCSVLEYFIYNRDQKKMSQVQNFLSREILGTSTRNLRAYKLHHRYVEIANIIQSLHPAGSSFSGQPKSESIANMKGRGSSASLRENLLENRKRRVSFERLSIDSLTKNPNLFNNFNRIEYENGVPVGIRESVTEDPTHNFPHGTNTTSNPNLNPIPNIVNTTTYNTLPPDISPHPQITPPTLTITKANSPINSMNPPPTPSPSKSYLRRRPPPAPLSSSLPPSNPWLSSPSLKADKPENADDAENCDDFENCGNLDDCDNFEPFGPSSSNNIFQILNESQRFNNPLVERVDFSGKPSKVEVDRKAQGVWYGGNGLGVLQNQDSWFVDEGIVSNELKYCSLKVLNNGNMIVNDFCNWDLIVVDSSMNEIKRLSGDSKEPPAYFKSLNTRSFYDSDYFVWLNKIQDVSAVRLSDFTFKTVKKFWNYKAFLASPVAVILGKDGDKLYGIGEINEKLNTLHCCTNAQEGVSIIELNSLHKSGKIN